MSAVSFEGRGLREKQTRLAVIGFRFSLTAHRKSKTRQNNTKGAMDWKIFVTTFLAIFIAELADKTQLVSIGMASKSGKPFSVWAGSVTAYLLITAVSVLLGALLGRYLRPDFVKIAGAVLFIVIGFLMLLGKV